jgi:hypothetical protein
MVVRALSLFVSSSPGLQVERDVIGRVVAEMPLTHGWEIGHTPRGGESTGTHLDQVVASDVYVLLLGHDFAAPMGAEANRALLGGQKPLAYRMRCTYSPSALDAIRVSSLDWQVFSTPDKLYRLFRRDLLRALVQQATAFGLDMGELQGLLKTAQQQAERLSDREAHESRGEAGDSGVILGREVWEKGLA